MPDRAKILEGITLTPEAIATAQKDEQERKERQQERKERQQQQELKAKQAQEQMETNKLYMKQGRLTQKPFEGINLGGKPKNQVKSRGI